MENSTVETPVEEGIIGETEDTVTLKKEFFQRLKETVEPHSLPDRNLISQISSSEISYENLMTKLRGSRRDNVQLKEVILQTEIDIPGTMENMRINYDQEIQSTLQRIQNHYDSKLQSLEELYRHNVVGKRLLSLIEEASSIGWHLVLKKNSFNLVKLYSPVKEINIGMKTDDGEKWIYESPFVKLKAIYVNMLHSQIGQTTIHVSTIGKHPNAQFYDFSAVCAGTLEGRSIKLDNLTDLIMLLEEISRTYEVAHLESAYYTPATPILRKEMIRGTQWTA